MIIKERRARHLRIPAEHSAASISSRVIAAIFSGEKHTSGYRIVLKSIVAKQNDVDVTYQETQPPENSFTLQVLTQPFVMIKISKPVGSVRLVKE